MMNSIQRTLVGVVVACAFAAPVRAEGPADTAEKAMDQSALQQAEAIRAADTAKAAAEAAAKSFKEKKGDVDAPYNFDADTDEKKALLLDFVGTQDRSAHAKKTKAAWEEARHAAEAWKVVSDELKKADEDLAKAEKDVADKKAAAELPGAKKPAAELAVTTAQASVTAAEAKRKLAFDAEAPFAKFYNEKYAQAATAQVYTKATAPDPEAGLLTSKHLFFETGVVGLSPYKIVKVDATATTPKRFYLDKAGTADVAGYVQVRIRNRDAWNDAEVERRGRDWCFFCPSTKLDGTFVPASISLSSATEMQDGKVSGTSDTSKATPDAQAKHPACPHAGCTHAAESETPHQPCCAGKKCDATKASCGDKGCDGSEKCCAEKSCTKGEQCSLERYVGQYIRTERFLSTIHLDYDLRVGFNYGQGSEVSGSAIAGAGDVNIAGAIGLPLLRVVDEAATQTVNVEGIFEEITDRGVSDIHHRQGVGLAWILGHRNTPINLMPGATPELKKRVYELALRATTNWVESPEIMAGNTVNIGTVAMPNLKPEVSSDSKTLEANFKRRSGVFGLDAELLIPVGSKSYWTAGASLFSGGNIDPNPWSVRLGLTIALDKLAGVFTSSVAGE